MLMKAQKDVNKMYNIINLEIIKICLRPQLGQICKILALKNVKIYKNGHQKWENMGRQECQKYLLKRLKVEMIKQLATAKKSVINFKNNLELFRVPKDIFQHKMI